MKSRDFEISYAFLGVSDPSIRVKVTQEWPDGTYAFPMPRGGCLSRWSSGNRYPRHRKSVDLNRRNKNKRWGTLPDGSYGRNTEIQYCYRNDGRHNRPMVLPTRRPFILYRYGLWGTLSGCERNAYR